MNVHLPNVIPEYYWMKNPLLLLSLILSRAHASCWRTMPSTIARWKSQPAMVMNASLGPVWSWSSTRERAGSLETSSLSIGFQAIIVGGTFA